MKLKNLKPKTWSQFVRWFAENIVFTTIPFLAGWLFYELFVIDKTLLAGKNPLIEIFIRPDTMLVSFTATVSTLYEIDSTVETFKISPWFNIFKTLLVLSIIFSLFIFGYSYSQEIQEKLDREFVSGIIIGTSIFLIVLVIFIQLSLLANKESELV